MQKFPNAPLPVLPRECICKIPQRRRYSNELRTEKMKSPPTAITKPFLNVSKKLGSHRAGSLKPTSLPFPELEWDFIIRFDSNWGNPSLITCSEIDFLDKNHLTCKVISISPMNSKEPVEPYFRLISGELNTTDSSVTWSHSWDSSEPLLIKITILSSMFPKYVRFWNVSFSPDANLKHFTIFFQNFFCSEGEVPQGFGVVSTLLEFSPEVQLNSSSNANSNSNAASISSSNSTPNNKTIILPSLSIPHLKLYFSDQYGKLPLPFIQKISIKVIETYNPNSNFVGLNCVEFFNTKGQTIPFSFIQNIHTSHGENMTSPFKVLKKKRRTSDIKDMWIAQKEGILLLEFDLKKPTQVIMMRIWNFNGEDFEKMGIKKAAILLDDMTYWVGKLNQGNLSKEVIFSSFTDIWFIDSIFFRDLPSISIINSTRTGSSQSISSSSS